MLSYLCRRSDLGVVVGNPEFGHKGLAPLMFRCGDLFYREIAPNQGDPAVKDITVF